MNETLLTPTGYESLKAELDDLINRWRPDIAQRIKEARELGDLKENAEYHAAKDEQAMYEAKIRRLEEQLRTARVVEDVDASVGGIGTTVTVTELESGDTETWMITGSSEADPLANKVSANSPMGAALTGAKAGDKVKVDLPMGEATFRVDEISRTS